MTCGIGLIGYDLSGALLHAPVIETVAGLRIVAVATGRDVTARRDRPRATDAASLIAAPDVDLVVVATSNDSHFALAMAALDAGKHVVVDKPFALSTADADRLIARAAERDLLLAVFHNRSFDGDFIAVRDTIPALGEIMLYEARWDRFRPEAPAGWRNTDAAGAGLLWDLGPHLIDQALLLFGWPDRLAADLATQRPGALAEDYFELTLHYGAMRCILSAASVVAAARPRFAAHGTGGSFATFGVDPGEAALRAGVHPADPGFTAALPPIPAVRTGPDGSRYDVAVRPGSWTGFYEQVAATIAGSRPLPRNDSARRVVALIELAKAAANSGSVAC